MAELLTSATEADFQAAKADAGAVHIQKQINIDDILRNGADGNMRLKVETMVKKQIQEETIGIMRTFIMRTHF
jgi:hypothetical protein